MAFASAKFSGSSCIFLTKAGIGFVWGSALSLGVLLFSVFDPPMGLIAIAYKLIAFGFMLASVIVLSTRLFWAIVVRKHRGSLRSAVADALGGMVTAILITVSGTVVLDNRFGRVQAIADRVAHELMNARDAATSDSALFEAAVSELTAADEWIREEIALVVSDNGFSIVICGGSGDEIYFSEATGRWHR